jgi:hypothetical protein
MEIGKYKQAMSFLMNPKYIRSDFVIPKQPVEEPSESEINLAEEINKILSTSEE